MTGKIFRAILSVTTTVLLIGFVVVTGFLYDYFEDIQVKQLKDELSLTATATEQRGIEYLSLLDADRCRITWIAADGTVLYDTQVNAGDMENHLNREEVREALELGCGNSSRQSSTLMQKNLYEAVLLSDGTVLRISVSQATATALVLGMIQPIVAIIIAAIILSAIIANRMAKKITEPLNRLDLDNPLENDAYEELSPLLNRIHQQHRQISAQLSELKQKTDEFEQITGNMKEGLVLLDNNRRVLSINPAAVALFNTTDRICIGKDFLTIDRKQDMNLAVEEALAEGHSEIRAERNGREFQFDISRIESDGEIIGAVLLAFDVTEQADLERIRREFTANVSHELKTPLQSIMGSAELIENGLVKADDMSRFISRIREEASRLVILVDDIIRLSQLDEGGEMPKEEVSLYALTKDAFFALQDAAEGKDVMLTVMGDAGNVNGVRRLLYEVIYNLCDNAVKYNVDGGSVNVSISENDKEVVCIVEDTGIGIPFEHQSRVFERFYRVDKSHSKKSGGTGLGLSIVKNVVLYHGGKLNMNSDENKGTTITFSIPKK